MKIHFIQYFQFIIEKTEAQMPVIYCSSNTLPVFFQRLISESINIKLVFSSLCKQCQSFSQASTFNTHSSTGALKNNITMINSLGIAKQEAMNTISSHLLKICLGIPAPSMSTYTGALRFSFNTAPKQLFLHPKNAGELV